MKTFKWYPFCKQNYNKHSDNKKENSSSWSNSWWIQLYNNDYTSSAFRMKIMTVDFEVSKNWKSIPYAESEQKRERVKRVQRKKECMSGDHCCGPGTIISQLDPLGHENRGSRGQQSWLHRRGCRDFPLTPVTCNGAGWSDQAPWKIVWEIPAMKL